MLISFTVFMTKNISLLIIHTFTQKVTLQPCITNNYFQLIKIMFFLSGTRFRPLSLDIPKPLFPIAGLPLIQHHIKACKRLAECKEILIIGSYTTTTMAQFVSDMQIEYSPVIIRYSFLLLIF